MSSTDLESNNNLTPEPREDIVLSLVNIQPIC